MFSCPDSELDTFGKIDLKLEDHLLLICQYCVFWWHSESANDVAIGGVAQTLLVSDGFATVETGG